MAMRWVWAGWQVGGSTDRAHPMIRCGACGYRAEVVPGEAPVAIPACAAKALADRLRDLLDADRYEDDPQPDADALAGLPAEVRAMVEFACRNTRARGRFAATCCRLASGTEWRADPIGCDAGCWLVAVCEADEIDRILRVAPGGSITREVA